MKFMTTYSYILLLVKCIVTEIVIFFFDIPKPHFTLTLLQKRTYQVHGSQLRVVQVTGIGEYCQEAACRWLPTAH